MTSQSLAAFRQTVTIRWAQERDADMKALLLKTAREGHEKIMGEQMARGGFAPTFEAYANRPGRPIDAVELPGPIVYRYFYFAEIVKVALDALRKASPVRSGAYRDSHIVLLNGTQVDDVPRTIGEGDEIMIVNPMPYARRIEIGKTKSGRDFVLQVPNRIYEGVAKRILRPRYRSVADIQFGYQELSGAYVITGGLSSHYGTGLAPGPRGGGTMRKRRQRIGEPIKSPAIFIKAYR